MFLTAANVTLAGYTWLEYVDFFLFFNIAGPDITVSTHMHTHTNVRIVYPSVFVSNQNIP